MLFSQKSVPIAIITALILLSVGPACAGQTLVLNLCQELVNMARSYESRAGNHNTQAKNIMGQIESLAKLPKNAGTEAAMDRLFSQYDENRALEKKYRELYRKFSEESDKCMKSVE